MHRSCADCIWSEDCIGKKPCGDFFNQAEDGEEAIDLFIEEERYAFYKEWETYINEYA